MFNDLVHGMLLQSTKTWHEDKDITCTANATMIDIEQDYLSVTSSMGKVSDRPFADTQARKAWLFFFGLPVTLKEGQGHSSWFQL